MDQTAISRAGTAGLAVLASVAFLWLLAKEAGRRLRHRRRARRAVRGEARAEEVLRRRGYAVLQRQVAATLPVLVDGELLQVALRADLLVRRGRRRLVAEVKTGELAPSLHHGPTRRQLLEYRLAFDVDGVLLVDVEGGQVHEVTFPAMGGAARRRPAAFAWVVVGAAAGAAIARWLTTGD